MRRVLFLIGLTVGSVCSAARAQTPSPPVGDALGMHSMTPGSGSSVTTLGTLGCTYCHAPHSGQNTQLWNQTLSHQSYTLYSSSTYAQKGLQPALGSSSSLCLSCHDGTVAVGQTSVYGKVPTLGSMKSTDSFGSNLSVSHPFSMATPLKDSIDLAASLVANGTTKDPLKAVNLINGNVECISCHNPHVQSADPVAQMFLVRDSSSGQMCLACHDPTRTTTGQVNRLNGWGTSVHATSTNQVAAGANVGLYLTVGLNACTSCHTEHNANGPARLLRTSTPSLPKVDVNTQDCITCHFNSTANLGNSGTQTLISPAAPNVYAEFNKISHPLPTGLNTHDEAELPVLNNNRHATCVDCHSPHGAQQLKSFTAAPMIRPPQMSALGISGIDGVTVVNPAVNQYETCLRCHGTSSGKQAVIMYGYLPKRIVSSADPLNLVPQFSINSTSSHPVMHAGTNNFPQPSLRAAMLNLTDGSPSITRTLTAAGGSIFCTDCHNSDDNREFGGTGPNGPHGSVYPHLLERNYQFTQANTPGGTVTNVYPSPDLSYRGPYAMCAKCHDLTNVVSNPATTSGTFPGSWSPHYLHVSTEGFSCSVCHTAHGMGATSPTISGQRLVNFDASVVAPNQLTPISYNRGSNTCTLVCHNVAHNANGSVTPVTGASTPSLQKPRSGKP